MESNNNDVFLQLVKDITYWGNLDEEEICVLVGRNKGYISQIKSRIKSGKADVPEGFINLLQLKFADILKRKNATAIVEDAPGQTLVLIVRVLSKVNILFSNEAQKIAAMTGENEQDVLNRMNADVQEEANSLFDELYKKSQ
jgi:hypothetical protein